ncbi:MAG: hypothetical protein ACO1HP_15070 [Bacteroidota bacterium]
MPRSKEHKTEFVAGNLPVVLVNGVERYVDGRLGELRNVKDPFDVIDCIEDETWEQMKPSDRQVVAYEFYGESI